MNVRPVKSVKGVTQNLESASVRKILDGMEKGRREAIAKAQARRREHIQRILSLLELDIGKGEPARGRAKRIAADLGGLLTERSVARILDILAVSPKKTRHTLCESDSVMIKRLKNH